MSAGVDFKEIDRLLHDAEHAKAGADFARMMSDAGPAGELQAKHDELLAKANQLDPDHTAPAWEEADV